MLGLAFNSLSGIGKIFRRYNIVEYKSPDDHMDIDTYYKVNGYACLFKSYGERVDDIKDEEVTISLFRYAKPRRLFRYFIQKGMVISNPYPGIYYVEGKTLFPVQIVVTKEYDGKSPNCSRYFFRCLIWFLFCKNGLF